MRILLVTGGFPLPSQTFIYRKVIALAKRGHAVTVATRRIGDWTLYPDPLPPNVEVIEMIPDVALRSGQRALSALRGSLRVGVEHADAAMQLYRRCQADPRTRDAPMRQFLRHLPFVGLRVDVAHFEFASLAAMYPLAHEVLGVPVVVSCRGSDVHVHDSRPEAEQRQIETTLREAAAVHCVSNAIAADVHAISGRKAGVWVNRPAVDVQAIAARPPRRDAPLSLLATGRLVWIKGFDYLLAALAAVMRRGIPFRAEILGDGELRNVVRYSIRDLGLAERVTLPGNVPSSDVLGRLQTTDVFVLSSVGEGISNAVLEAMASGVPVVTTDAGGMAEAVTDGVEGFVVPVRNPTALADKIVALANDEARRAAMGLAARRRAEHEFSLERQATVFEDMYRAVTS